MEPVTLFLKPSFQIAVQPGTGALEVQVAVKKPQVTPAPAPQGVVQAHWLSRH